MSIWSTYVQIDPRCGSNLNFASLRDSTTGKKLNTLCIVREHEILGRGRWRKLVNNAALPNLTKLMIPDDHYLVSLNNCWFSNIVDDLSQWVNGSWTIQAFENLDNEDEQHYEQYFHFAFEGEDDAVKFKLKYG